MVTLTITTEDGRVATIAVAPSETIENVKALVEVELGILLMQQQLVYNGRTLGNEATVRVARVRWGSKCVSAHSHKWRELPRWRRQASKTATSYSCVCCRRQCPRQPPHPHQHRPHLQPKPQPRRNR